MNAVTAVPSLLGTLAPALEQPWRCDALSLFVEPSVGAPLQLLRRYALSGQDQLRS